MTINDKTRLSVVIVNYRADDYLKECTRSIQAQQGAGKTETIIVENGEGDYSDPVFKDAILIRNSGNEGFARANNVGFGRARGDLVLILNPDTVLPENTLERCCRYMEANPKIGVLGCKLLNSDGTLQSSCRNFPGMLTSFVENMGFYRWLGRIGWLRKRYLMVWEHDVVRRVDSVKGAFMLTRRNLIREIGGFDERFFMYCEEVDFCLRAKRAGYEVVFYPEAAITHFGGKSTEIHSLRNLIELHRSYRLYCRKHFGPVKSAVCIFLYFFGVCSRALLHVQGVWSQDERKRRRFRLFYETAKSYFK
ncbi:MAG: glycosyltransferase family 2 protein [bacterium]|nr:glycosyltransferase family 2 protein [bacterium]